MSYVFSLMERRGWHAISIGIGLILVLVSSSIQPAEATSLNVGGFRIKKDVKTLREIKRRHVVTQSLDFSCGAAGLSTLLNFYLDNPVSEKTIIEKLLQTVPLEKVKARRGFSLFDLKRFAESLGYKVTGYKMDFDFLRDLGKPVLVPIRFKNYRHFVIVKGVIGDRVFIADPAIGNMSMKAYQFEDMWLNGIGLVIENADEKGNVLGYPLKVDEKDLLVADYKALRRLVDKGRIRTQIHTNEYK